MVKPALLIVGAIPIILALLIAVPMVTKPEIPRSAVVPEDQISIEYTKHQLKVVSFGVAERAGSQFTEILSIDNEGETGYSVIEEGFPKPEEKSTITEAKLKKLTALIKETGFMAIPTESFPIREGTEEYQKSTIKVTLNRETRQIHWPEQNATDSLIPPIIVMLEAELDTIIKEFN